MSAFERPQLDAVSSADSGRMVSFRVVYATPMGRIRARNREVIRDPATWRSVWLMIAGPDNQTKVIPPIDFARETAVLVSMGAQPTAGVSIEVTTVSECATRSSYLSASRFRVRPVTRAIWSLSLSRLLRLLG